MVKISTPPSRKIEETATKEMASMNSPNSAAPSNLAVSNNRTNQRGLTRMLAAASQVTFVRIGCLPPSFDLPPASVSPLLLERTLKLQLRPDLFSSISPSSLVSQEYYDMPSFTRWASRYSRPHTPEVSSLLRSDGAQPYEITHYLESKSRRNSLTANVPPYPVPPWLSP